MQTKIRLVAIKDKYQKQHHEISREPGCPQLPHYKQIKSNKNVQQVWVIPLDTETYKIEVIYLKEKPTLIQNDNFAGVDIGLNNLATVVSNYDLKLFIINIKPLKQNNQYYNKKLATLKSEMLFFR